VQNFKTTKTFAARCGASVPAWLADRFDGLDDDAATRKLIAAAVAAEQVLDLVDHGVTDFHFYTMNRADLVYAICHLLGLRPNARGQGTGAADAHGALPLPGGERVGVRGLRSIRWAGNPLTRRASRVDLSPPGRGEGKCGASFGTLFITPPPAAGRARRAGPDRPPRA
jgi:predicted GNAT superfamily acetyltransferase